MRALVLSLCECAFFDGFLLHHAWKAVCRNLVKRAGTQKTAVYVVFMSEYAHLRSHTIVYWTSDTFGQTVNIYIHKHINKNSSFVITFLVPLSLGIAVVEIGSSPASFK